MWQVSIGELGKLLDAPWIAVAVAVVIVLCGLIVDAITTYFNNDYTEVAAKHTAEMRQHKAELDPNYKGDRFFVESDDIFEEEEVGASDEQ
jgi:hypothetical protein